MKKVLFLAAVLALAVCATPAVASQALSGITAYEAGAIDYWGGSGGYQFTVGSQDLQVGKLGYFADRWRYSPEQGYYLSGSDGLPAGATHEVGIFDATGALLGKVTVTGQQSAYSNRYVWESLASPIALQAGQTYTIAAYFGWPSNDYSLPRSFTGTVVMPEITVNGFYINGAQLVVPPTGTVVTLPTNSTNYTLYDANFETVVPEPATMGLLGLGLVGLMARRNKK